MALEVYINGELIELKANINIGLTFQVGSILNLSGRSGNLSNKFTVPKTQTNTRILGQILNVNSGSNIPYQRNTGKIVQNGIELFPSGLPIVESSGNDYSLTVYSGNVSFFDLIKGRNINELDWSDSCHDYTIPIIIGSFTNNSDYIYPIIDWGEEVDLLDNTTLQNSDALLPCARMSAVLNKIVSGAGYELKGTFKDVEQYNRLILTPNKFGFTEEQAKENSGLADEIIPIPTTNVIVANQPAPPVVVTPVLEFTNSTNTNVFTLKVPPLTTSYVPLYVISGVLTFTVDWTPKRLDGSISAFNEYKFQILEDGIEIASNSYTASGSYAGARTDTVTTGTIVLDPAKEYTTGLVFTLDSHPTVTYDIDYSIEAATFTATALQDIPYGGKIDFATMFDWDQDKLLKDVLNQYSLTIQTNEITKQVFITPLDDLALNLPLAKDWSQKMDVSKSPSIKFRLSGYGQRNYFNYQETEEVEEDFGRGFFDIDDTSLNAESNIITLNSAAAVAEERVEDHHTPVIPFMTGPSKSFEKKLSRHLLLDPEDQTLDLKNTVNGDTGSTFADIPFCYFKKSGKVDSLDFQSLLEDNYTILQGMTNKVKFISAFFILKEVDVKGIDFTVPIFLDIQTPGFHANGYFYINKISNFKDNAPTKVDLIRL